jgi:hypothetical protein
MKKLTFVILVSIVLFSCKGKNENSKQIEKELVEKEYLFNNKDFSGWDFFLADSTKKLSDVWSVKDSVIHCKGKPFGYLYTKKEYESFKLHVEWRWPGEAGNSGIFLFITGKHKQWPSTVEAQLWSGNAGDLVTLGGAQLEEITDEEDIVLEKRNESTEKEPGKWNTYEIICKGNKMDVLVNDILQNAATVTTGTKGNIGLQSEGAPIEFRNIYIEKLEE